MNDWTENWIDRGDHLEPTKECLDAAMHVVGVEPLYVFEAGRSPYLMRDYQQRRDELIRKMEVK